MSHSVKGPFVIKTTKQVGGATTIYKHVLMLYNAEIGFKLSNTPFAPEWMRSRQALGNTAHFLDGSYPAPKSQPRAAV